MLPFADSGTPKGNEETSNLNPSSPRNGASVPAGAIEQQNIALSQTKFPGGGGPPNPSLLSVSSGFPGSSSFGIADHGAVDSFSSSSVCDIGSSDKTSPAIKTESFANDGPEKSQSNVSKPGISDTKELSSEPDGPLLKYDPSTNIKKIISDPGSKEPTPSLQSIQQSTKDGSTNQISCEISALIASTLPPAPGKKDGAENLSEDDLERELANLDDEDNASFDEDDAAVYLQELGINFGLSARSSSRSGGRSRLGGRHKTQSALSRRK